MNIKFVTKSKETKPVSEQYCRSELSSKQVDMVSKFEIALKEANETENWLDLIYKSNMLYDQKYKLLKAKIVKIKKLLIKSINTLKASIK